MPHFFSSFAVSAESLGLIGRLGEFETRVGLLAGSRRGRRVSDQVRSTASH
jgi:hypothetical protein